MNPKVGEDGRYEVVRVAGPEGRRLSETTRYLVLRRDRCQCVWCGNQGLLEVDHIIPWSAGGSDDMDNLRTLCQRCNQERSNFASASDTEQKRFLTAHECVYCTPALLGDPEVVQVYCTQCNKRAPGLPLNPPETPTQETPEFSDEDLYGGNEYEALDALAAKYRAAAIETIRQALDAPTHPQEASNA